MYIRTMLVFMLLAIITLSANADIDTLPRLTTKSNPEVLVEHLPFKVAMSILPRDRFYGKVIDQYGNPVVNAQIRYEGTHGFLSSGSGLGAVFTDDKGNFEIDSHGEALILASVIHPEIEYSYPLKTPVGVENERAGYPMLRLSMGFRSTDKDPRYDDARKYQNRETPFVIQAWRLGEYSGATGGNVDGHLTRDGSINTIRLTQKRNARRVLDGESSGHLHVNCTRKLMDNKSDLGDWSVTIAPIDGGIQATNDLYMNLAPSDGYKPSLTINMRLGAEDYYFALLNKRYYFISNNGRDYGSLYVNFQPYIKFWEPQPCIVRIKYKINSTGSRSLELTKNKELLRKWLLKREVKLPKFEITNYGVIQDHITKDGAYYEITETDQITKEYHRKGTSFGIFVSLSENPEVHNPNDLYCELIYPNNGLIDRDTGNLIKSTKKCIYKHKKKEWILSTRFEDDSQIQKGKWLFQLKFKDKVLLDKPFYVE